MARLESVERYLASVPGGIEAYPDCAHKGEPLSLWLQRSPTRGIAELLPRPIGALLADVRRLPTWVPEVHATALYLAIREAHFADDDAFLTHARACNQAVLATPTNRVLFWVAAPKAILRAAGLRWGTLHQGSSIDVRITSDTSAEATLRFPPNLLPEIVLRGNGSGFVAAIENAGGRDGTFELRAIDATHAEFVGAWR